MSHQDLARLSVRLLHDPVLAARVADGEAIAGFSDEELAWIRAVDPRAWEVDTQRRQRVLKSLFDEFKGSATLVTGATRSYAAMLGFFESAEFHDEVQARGSLAEGFARFLLRLGAELPALSALVTLERAGARVRRELDLRPARMTGPGFVRARGIATALVDDNTLENLNRLEVLLFELSLYPALGLTSDGPPLPELLGPSDRPVHLLVTAQGLRVMGPRATSVIAALDTPVADLQALAVRLGVAPEHAARLEADLQAHGFVVVQ